MTSPEKKAHTLAESTMKVMSAIAEERLWVVVQAGQIRYYIIPSHLIHEGQLKAGVVSQFKMDGTLDFFEGEKLVGSVRVISIPQEDEVVVRSFIQDLL